MTLFHKRPGGRGLVAAAASRCCPAVSRYFLRMLPVTLPSFGSVITLECLPVLGGGAAAFLQASQRQTTQTKQALALLAERPTRWRRDIQRERGKKAARRRGGGGAGGTFSQQGQRSGALKTTLWSSKAHSNYLSYTLAHTETHSKAEWAGIQAAALINGG